MRLKELRDRKGVTQEQVAKSICCTACTYSRYEREEREPSVSTLNMLADYFETSIDYLVGRSEV